jgi:hypothetical protein
MWSLGYQKYGVSDSVVPNILVDYSMCETSSTNNENEFFIYGGGRAPSQWLNQVACDDPVIARQFGRVKSFWHVNDEHTLEYVGKGVADLVLVKENLMQALNAEVAHGYTKIASYSQYQAYFIARVEKPILTKTYLLDKTIGLLNYPTSRSGYIIPKQLLTELGLDFEKLDIVYASSHAELRSLLSSGKVDIISSYWQEEDNKRFSANYRLPLLSPLSGSSWYIKAADRNDDLLCTAQHLLSQLAKGESSSYYQNIKLVPFSFCASQLQNVDW